MPTFYHEEFSLEYLPNSLDTGLLQKELERQQILSGPTRDKILFKINGVRYEHNCLVLVREKPGAHDGVLFY